MTQNFMGMGFVTLAELEALSNKGLGVFFNSRTEKIEYLRGNHFLLYCYVGSVDDILDALRAHIEQSGSEQERYFLDVELHLFSKKYIFR